MTSRIILRTKKLAAAFLLLNLALALFAETEEEKKKRILNNADLSGESLEELMAGDDADDGGSEQHRLPSEFPREVPYTAESRAFSEAYLGHKISSDEIRKRYYDAAVAAAEKSADEYSRLVRLARTDYCYGNSLIENFDLTSLDNMDLGDTSSGANFNDEAGGYFDRGIEKAKAALEIKAGSDAYSILAHLISANCTTKNTSYILANGLKVRANAKKGVKKDYSNGTAHFLVVAQDAYAPWPFCKIQSSRKKFLSILDDKYIRLEDFDRIVIYEAIGYGFFRQKKWDKAAEWYNKVLAEYPANYTSNDMLKKIAEKKASK